MNTQADPLLDVIDKLTIEHIETTRLDDGTNHYERHDGLIKQLRDAIASNLGGGSAGGKDPRERIPLDGDAMVKYDQIETAIGERFRALGQGVPGLYPEDTLRVWYRTFTNAYRAGQVSDAGYDDELRTMEGWARIITEKLSPPTPLELLDTDGQPAVCPECGAGWYEVILNSGNLPKPHTDADGTVHTKWYEKERRVALNASYSPDDHGTLTTSFVRCGCCNHVWMGTQGIRALAYELEHPNADTTAKAGGAA